MPDCLIIDDEPSIATTICEYFGLFDVSCEYATDYETGLKTAIENSPSLILLDVNLGGKSGYALCKTLRETSDVPILFISARNTDDDVLTALGVGGDDYMTKPFSMSVLLAKARAMLKRSASASKNPQIVAGATASAPAAAAAAPAPAADTTAPALAATLLNGAAGEPALGTAKETTTTATSTATAAPSPAPSPASPPTSAIAPATSVRFGRIEIERDNGRATREGVAIKLKPMELKLLLYLFDNQGHRVTKDELLEKVWGDTFVGEGTLSVHVRHLREKLENDPKNPQYIKTMWGSGYMFEAHE